MAGRRHKKKLNGDDLIYRFFKELFADEGDDFGDLPAMMLWSMGIWLPLDMYFELPIVLPWVVRDSKCRGQPAQGIPDRWSAPNESGYQRDDNSMIKSIPRSMPVRSPGITDLDGAVMKSKFVASHVWREVNHVELASRVPVLNSFAPNLVWLPSQIAKLTDLEGSMVQRTLQSISWAIYRNAPVQPRLREAVEAAWSLLPVPAGEVDVDVDQLNWFIATEKQIRTKQSRIEDVIDALDLINENQPIPSRLLSTRYREGLPEVTKLARDALREELRAFDSRIS